MAKITRLDKPTVNKLRDMLNAYMEAFEKEHGLKVEFGRMQFNDKNVQVKVGISVVSPDGTAETKTRTDFTRYATSFGLEPDDLDKEVVLNGRRVKIVGLSVKKKKYPIVIRVLATDEQRIVPINAVRHALGRPIDDIYDY